MAFPDHIFKAYDIRGLVEGELSVELAELVGRSFVRLLTEKGTAFQGKSIVVGYDMRPTSQPFKDAVIKGITEEGVDVVDVGMVTTPLFNFACAHYPDHAGGIMVTASHNPAEYNGFKLTMEDGLPIGKNNGMSEIKNYVQRAQFEESDREAGVSQMNVLGDYLARIFSLVKKENIQPLKIVIDAGNGMGKVTIPPVLEQLPVEVEYLYLEPDGTFPNHEANPLKVETLKDLQKKVVETGADFGFALDGDADRVGLVDEKGDVVPASFVGALIGLEVLKKHPESLMLYDLRMSRRAKEVWEAAGAKTDMSVVGHALIKKQMKDMGAVYAAELSQHLYFSDMYDVESTDLSLLYFLEMVSTSGKKMSEIWRPLDIYAHSGEINFEVEDKDSVLAALKEKYSDADMSEIDGVLFMYEDWWFNVRASNTEPVLRLNLETKDAAMMDEKVAEVTQVITNN